MGHYLALGGKHCHTRDSERSARFSGHTVREDRGGSVNPTPALLLPPTLCCTDEQVMGGRVCRPLVSKGDMSVDVEKSLL